MCFEPAVVGGGDANRCARKVEGEDIPIGFAFGSHLGCTLLAKTDAVTVAVAVEDERAVPDAEIVGVSANAVPAESAADAETQRGSGKDGG